MNFKRKNTSKRDKIRKVNFLNNWTTPKSVRFQALFKKGKLDG
jgi:hypothetical protein